jgi:LuxR family maltose regulon positive regulatory protein
MTRDLVETKLFLPQVRADAVPRPRLDALLGDRRRLTLVSAPAGFGKTTLVGSWLARLAAGAGCRVAWVSLDAGDREAGSFWTYVLTALDRAAPGTGSAGLAALAAGRPVEAALAVVLNELSVLDDDVVLVLDDYHLAESPEVQSGTAFLLERLPPQLRLVLVTRADPALPVARLRARGELSEVRAADLRFTDAETSEFLATTTGRALAEADVAALGHRTEGWIASLQLAAISLRDRADPAAFIAGFAGDDRFVVDYLVEEVLDEQAPEVRDFLLRTAVLDRLTGSLCDAVTGGTGGSRLLESLERRNLFVVPLDDRREWYRYHHLFADMLRARLLQQAPDSVAGLQRRASGWFADRGDIEPAIRHALAAGDDARAAELAEVAVPELRRARRESVLRRWAHEFPAAVVQNRPVLAIGLVSGLMASNEFDEVEGRLRDIEAMLAEPRSDLVVVDTDELARLPAAIETYRSGLALVAGDPAATVRHADAARERAAPGDDLTRSAAAALAGLAHWSEGDLEAAHTAYRAGADGLARADHIADVLGCSLALADLELALGRLGAAERTLDAALALAERHRPENGVLRGTADMLVAQSRVAWHRDDLVTAADLVRRADDLGESAGLPQHPYRWRVALARLRTAEGDHATALALLDEAERVYVGDFLPPVHPIHATRARVLLRAGDVAAAGRWAHDHGLSPDDDLDYLREYEHLTLARVLLARHLSDRATAPLTEAGSLLGRLLAAAAAGGRLGTVLEVEILRARALHLAGEDHPALAALEHAVDLAEGDGWIRPFVDAGPGLAPVLRALGGRRPGSELVARLLAAPAAAAPRTAPPSGGLVDPLSDRELDVLRLLASDLDGPAIARELVVSLNTVRTHTKHIYTKLDVNNRRSAVSRAHQLGLLSRAR